MTSIISVPQSGEIFREYKWNGPWINSGEWQRVTDPQSLHEGAEEFLPNPVNRIEITDFSKAIRVEVVIEQLQCHAGTSGKALRINGNDWIVLPVAREMGPGIPEAYQHFTYPAVPVPLGQFIEGDNRFEFTSGGQIAHDFQWGQWILYGVIFRVYYDASYKSHPTGQIIYSESKDLIGGDVEFLAEVKPAKYPIKSLDFIGFYEDFDINGDGIYEEWHFVYRYGEMRHHIGTAVNVPYRVIWDTTWIPDQIKPMKVMARITDESGISYMTPVVESIELKRDNYSVKLYKPYNIPSNWQTRNKRKDFNNVMVNDDLSCAAAAKMILISWNGVGMNEIGINDIKLLENIGFDHNLSYNEIDVPLDLIQLGENSLYTYSVTLHHGIEVQWPGIALKILYKWQKKNEQLREYIRS